MMGYGHGFGFGMGGGFTGILLLGLVFFAIYYFAIKNKGGSNYSGNVRHGSKNEALEIAELRFAKGEISRNEYQEIKNNLLA